MAMLTLDALKESGGFVGRPVKKEIVWTDENDNEHRGDVFVRRMSYAAIQAEIMSRINNGDSIAARIASAIVDENDTPIFTVGDIVGTADASRGPMSSSLTVALLNAIDTVNPVGKKKT